MKIGSTDIVNCKIGSTQVNEVRIGSTLVWQFSSVDPDAEAFITAAGITNPTQQTAINTLVVSLKANGIWTKMKAIYPFVGNTAFSHKFNLKNPLDTNAAFRLVFNGGIVHNANGITLNGTNGFADTYFNANTNNLTNGHISIYNRTNNAGSYYDFSNLTGAFEQTMILKFTDNKFYVNSGTQTYPNFINSDARGMYAMNYNLTNVKGYKNGSVVITENKVSTGVNNFYSIGRNSSGQYSNRNYAFASIGDGLTDTDSSNLYTAVQAFQTTLGRSVGPQTVSDADAQAFVTAANIQDQVQADAVNNLVIGLKADGLWTKMKAIYPFVGGDATSHKWNLKDPRDLNIAFRLVFNGGWTHSANGATPNGTNAYADTFLNPSLSLAQNSTHLSYYSRTNVDSNTSEIGAKSPSTVYLLLQSRLSNNFIASINEFYNFSDNASNTNGQGFYVGNRTNLNVRNSWKNGTKLHTSSSISQIQPNLNLYISALNNAGVTAFYSTKQCAFASIGDGLTDTDSANLYTNVQAFQTSLGRQI